MPEVLSNVNELFAPTLPPSLNCTCVLEPATSATVPVVAGKVRAEFPVAVRLISAPLIVNFLDEVPPDTSNPSELFVMSRLTEFCLAIFRFPVI